MNEESTGNFEESSKAGIPPVEESSQENEYHPGSPVSPELFQEIYLLLNEGHRIDFAKATDLDKVRGILDQQIRQHQSKIDLFNQAFEPKERRENQDEKARGLLGKLDTNISPAIAESMRKRVTIEKEKIDKLQNLLNRISAQ